MFKDLSSDEIKELLSVQKVLNALLDKISNVEESIAKNREEINSLSKLISTMSERITGIEISTGNDLNQLKKDTTSLSHKLYSIEQNVKENAQYLKTIEKLCKQEKPKDEQENQKKKENNDVNRNVKELKKVIK